MNETPPNDVPPDDADSYWESVARQGEQISRMLPCDPADNVLALPGTHVSGHESDQPPALVPASELMARELTRRPWLVEGVIPAKQVCELRGDGGTGKSTLALQLCVAAVTGRAWIGMPVKVGPAIYLASEDDEDEVQRRLDAIAVHLQVTPADLQDLHVWPLATEDPALVVPGEKGVEPTERWGQLRGFVEALKPAVIILDSRADVFGGEEISRKQVRAFVALLRKLAVQSGAAVIILAHPSVAGLANRSGNSGSTHWNNAVRAAINLYKPQVEDAAAPDPDLRILEVVKNNYARIEAPTMLRMSAGALVIEEGHGPANTSREEAQASVDRLFLDLLAKLRAQGRHVSDSAGGNYAPKEFAQDPAAKAVTKKAFAASMRRLLDAGKLRVEMVGPPSRQHREIVEA